MRKPPKTVPAAKKEAAKKEAAKKEAAKKKPPAAKPRNRTARPPPPPGGRAMKPNSPRAAADRRVGFKRLARRRRPPRSALLDIMQAGIGPGRAICGEKAGGTWISTPTGFPRSSVDVGRGGGASGRTARLGDPTRPEHLCRPPQLCHSDDPPRARRPR